MSESYGAPPRILVDLWTPEPLFKICLDYVGRNVDMIESLINFPEIVGEQILQNCVQCGYFSENTTTSVNIINLFVGAYGQQFMQSFQCMNLQLVNEYCECLEILCLPVTHLDFHGCRLGNNNDILRAVVDMENLKVLNLSCNDLSEDGFRQLLARFKMYKRGFQALESLDISENLVNIKTLKTLLSLPKLKNLRISLTSSLVMGNSQFVEEWQSCIKHQNFEIMPLDRKIANNIETKGWGTSIVDVWKKKVEELETARQAKLANRCQSFYALGLKKKLGAAKPNVRYQKFDTYTYIKRKIGRAHV